MQNPDRITRLLRRLPAAPILLLAACLGGCLFGTTTESENTAVPVSGQVNGRILLSDGKPAAGARIMVRSGKVEVSAGIPSWSLSSLATADSGGRFQLAMPESLDLYLEIRERILSSFPSDSDRFPEAYFAHLERGRPGIAGTATYRLGPTGALHGRMALKSGQPPVGIWLGIKGSSSLIRLESAPDSASGTSFRLEGVPAGNHALTVVDLGKVSTAGYVQVMANDSLAAEVKPETITEMGTIFYNDTSRAGPQ